VTRYRWIDSQKADGFPVSMACAVVEVSTSAYYEHRALRVEGPTLPECMEADLVAKIGEIWEASDRTYGEPRVPAELARQGWVVNHKRVERLMRTNGMGGVHQRRRPRTTTPCDAHPVIPDLIGRDFDAGAPDVAWCGDITYIPTGEGWLFLASVLDLGSRRLVGYSMGEHMPTRLCLDALNMAVDLRGGVMDTIFHSDRGSQYMSHDFQAACKAAGIRQSVGRTGVCWDNAVAESFWSSLKRELVDRTTYATRAEARRAIFAWISRYNHVRLHSTLGMVPPVEWEQHYQPGQQAA